MRFETTLNKGKKVLTRYWERQLWMKDYFKKEKNLIEIKGNNIRCYFIQEQLEISLFIL